MQSNQLSNRIWLGSVAFSTSFLLGLLVDSGNFNRALIAGFITLPSSLAGAFIAERRDIQENIIDGVATASNTVVETAIAAKHQIQEQIHNFQQRQHHQAPDSHPQSRAAIAGTDTSRNTLPAGKTQPVNFVTPPTPTPVSVSENHQLLDAEELEIVQPETGQVDWEKWSQNLSLVEEEAPVTEISSAKRNADLEEMLSSVADRIDQSPTKERVGHQEENHEFEEFLDQMAVSFQPPEAPSRPTEAQILEKFDENDEDIEYEVELIKESQATEEFSVPHAHSRDEDEEYDDLMSQISGILDEPEVSDKTPPRATAPSPSFRQTDEAPYDEYEQLMAQISNALDRPDENESFPPPKDIFAEARVESDKLKPPKLSKIEPLQPQTTESFSSEQPKSLRQTNKQSQPETLHGEEADELDGVLTEEEEKELEELLWGSTDSSASDELNRLFGQSNDRKRQK